MNDTWVTIRGRMTADPTIRTTGDGVPVASFSVATNPRKQVAGQPGTYEDGPTSFYRVSAWRSLGANAAASLRKGEPVTVYGRQVVRDYPRGDGTTGTRAELDAEAIGHDLRWGTTRYTKNGGGSVGRDAAQETAGQPWELGDPGQVDYVVDDGAGSSAPGATTGSGHPGATTGSGHPDATTGDSHPSATRESGPARTGPLVPVGAGDGVESETSAA
ncbi:MAG: single-stranded DNA-binding protein [Phycicoccus sp.]